MKGVSFIEDDKREIKSVVIDLKTIRKNHEEVHELIDTLVAESRKDDEAISWNEAKMQLSS